MEIIQLRTHWTRSWIIFNQCSQPFYRYQHFVRSERLLSDCVWDWLPKSKKFEGFLFLILFLSPVPLVIVLSACHVIRFFLQAPVLLETMHLLSLCCCKFLIKKISMLEKNKKIVLTKLFKNDIISLVVGELCHGSTTDSDSVCWGSNPYSPANASLRVGLLFRGVAQFGRALRSGRRGRRFESCHLDFYFSR